MKIKIIICSIILLLFSACNDNKSKQEVTNKDNTQTNKEINQEKKEVEFNKLIKFSLNFYNSDEKFMIKRKSENNKDLEFENNDKLIMFVFFTTWCPPCKAEIPHLNNLQTKYQDRLRIIGILLEDKTNSEIADFIKENNINFDIATGSNNYTFLKVLDGINGIPYIAFYNADGKNINNYIGAVYEEMLDIDIQKVLN